ncbi:MAG TPA: RNA polymerase sporulation sigma factor SigH [Epulopiscium sp.]|nr:RNA polymerase sporulation sigma factor SigH [Candidatus Epulonipiscium sp.]
MGNVKQMHMSMTQLEGLEDEHLIEIYKKGYPRAAEVLVHRYKNFVRSNVRTNFFIGADKEDLIQEGMIGLFKAISDYDITRKASFRSFASICIKGQISTALKTATRQKHMVLNTSVSLDRPMFDEEEDRTTFMDLLKIEPSQGPEELLIRQEKMKMMEKKLNTVLSKLESSVLKLYLEGQSYSEISKLLNRPDKSIDNALQRIKGKLEGLQDEDVAN